MTTHILPITISAYPAPPLPATLKADGAPLVYYVHTPCMDEYGNTGNYIVAATGDPHKTYLVALRAAVLHQAAQSLIQSANEY